MKRDFLRTLDIGNGAHLSEAVVDAIMAEYGKSHAADAQTIQTLTTERDTLRGQLEGATAEIQSFKAMDIDGIQRKAKEWEERYNADTKKLQEDLAAERYGFSVREAAAGLKFSSTSAQKAFVADLTAKKLPVQDGKLLGFDDFVSQYKAGDPAAFASEGKTPEAVRGGSGGAPSAGGLDSLRAAFGLGAK